MFEEQAGLKRYRLEKEMWEERYKAELTMVEKKLKAEKNQSPGSSETAKASNHVV